MRGNITGFGESSSDEVVLAYLRGLDGPASTPDLQRLFGSVRYRTDFVFLERGVVTSPERVSDWGYWLERLPPVARSVTEEVGPGRQWTTAKLVTELASRVDVPPWMNQWTLASLIRADGDLRSPAWHFLQ